MQMLSAQAPPSGDQIVESRFIRPFRSISSADVATVGGKNASLGEMYQNLGLPGVLVPNGFAVTADAYRFVMTEAGAWAPVRAALDEINPANIADLERRAAAAHAAVMRASLPADLVHEILTAYHALRIQYGPEMTVAVRSSATAEDLPTASFAGQHLTFLNVSGDEQLLEAYRRCLASLFLERAIHYCIDQGFDHFKVAQSVGVMKMVRSDLAAAGVAFTIDTETGFRGAVLINGSYGLAENVVQGTIDPDEFFVHKATFEQGYRAVLQRRLGTKALKLIFADGSELDSRTRNVETSPIDRERFCITDEEVLALTACCLAIEKHYSAAAGHAVPMDLEWAKDGLDDLIYLVQARPETAASQRQVNVIEEFRLTGHGSVLVRGRAVGARVGAGPVHLVRTAEDLKAFKPGEVLVAQTTTPDWEPVMKIASAIVTDRGGRTCHAAILARELGIPAVVGTGSATSTLINVPEVTVSCALGETGEVYAGRIPFERKLIDVTSLPQVPVKIMLTLGNPEVAFARSMLPNDGVGLVRIEFIVSDEIKAHPMALLHPERIKDASVLSELTKLTRGFASPSDYFVRKLAEGVATIAAAFYPKPVVVRMSDFKSNEYAKLVGGACFESVEENPMLGLRGASRYTHPSYAEGFALECAAMKYVREKMGLDNVILMIPFAGASKKRST